MFQVFVPSQDCDDSSDEKKCRMVSFDEEKYLKNKPPPPPRGLEKLSVTARYTDLYEYISKRIIVLSNLSLILHNA